MRKLLIGALLSTTLPAFAGIADDLNSGMSVAQAYQNAAAACASSDCDAIIAQEMLEAGVSAEMIMAAVIEAGVPAAQVIQAAADAAFRAGVDVNDVMAAVVNIPGASATDAVEGLTRAAVGNNIPVAQVMVAANNANINPVSTVAGISQAGVSQTVIETSASSVGISSSAVSTGIATASTSTTSTAPTSLSQSVIDVFIDNVVITPGGDSES